MRCKIERFDHVQLSMPPDKAAEARAFYAESLSFNEIDNPGSNGGLWFSAGGIEIHLGINPLPCPNPYAHIAFKVTGLDALLELFTKKHIIFEERISSACRRLYVNDPFGNRLEFFET